MIAAELKGKPGLHTAALFCITARLLIEERGIKSGLWSAEK